METLKDILWSIFTPRGITHTAQSFFDKPGKYLVVILLFLILVTLLGAWPIIGVVLLIYIIIWIPILIILAIRVILEKS